VRNLILFLWRHQFTAVFILLEAVALYLVVRSNNYQRTNFMGWSNELTGGLYSRAASAKAYLHLRETNKILVIENERLRNESRNAWHSNDPRLRYENDTLFRRLYKYIYAEVVNKTGGNRNNYLTLNRGRKHGIRPQMGVVTENGVVGVVQNVSENYCSVMSFLHQKSVVSASHKASGYFGPLTWSGISPTKGTLADIPLHVDVARGDTIVTRGFGTLFPPDIVLGYIKEIYPQAGTDFFEIEVELSMDFNQISDVYVIEHLDAPEIEELEDKNAAMDGK
jgi:rod shape-determining protein MreC